MSDRTWLIEAEIMPKRGVNDPQGDVIKGSLDALGFAGVGQVRCGKVIRIQVTAPSVERARAEGTAMCDKLLANPVIEEYTLSVSTAEGENTR
ncbi:MAG: Phosphoribosylformylglycinamidine synthase, PurS subunit [uncultured Thermomicrobiales bacterium]|uniref:Phosphoribosylformylglycinamidine synthase subunit PurS n=1 Tax=uncultured Thermomicrobiales bacterium TaxID=1645740 RepID=A0A6J4UF05_9BACT|nr:MAG: Phosphoribosylformylglycinamidine synthase, PurS subunit [uncultured Thermomicrobiales bacterium]